MPFAHVAIAMLCQWSSVLTLQRIGKNVLKAEWPMYLTTSYMTGDAVQISKLARGSMVRKKDFR